MGLRQRVPMGHSNNSTSIDSGTKVRAASPRPGPKRRLKNASSPRMTAMRMVRRFRKRAKGPQAFTKMRRRRVARGLLRRLRKPSLIHQKNTQMCGPTTVVFGLASRKPVVYARFVIDLFEKGKARLGRMLVRPSSDCRRSRPRKSKKGRVIADVDWIPLASLRDNSNRFLSVETTTSQSRFWAGLEGVTSASQIIEWFTAAGYTVVDDEASALALASADKDTLMNAMKAYDRNEFVVMCLDPDIIKGKSTTFERHWVALTGPIWLLNGQVSFDCFTWGQGNRTVAAPLEKFLNDFYGYISVAF